ncbi:MAG: sensor histidine kinase [Rectinemataceae bacterium]
MGETGLLEMLPVGIFTIDVDWSITFWNRRLADWTGIEAVHALGQLLHRLLPRFEEDSIRARLDFLMQGGPPVVFSYQLHEDLFPHRGDDRIQRVRYCTASSIPGGGIIFSIEDRTEVAALVHEAHEEILRRRKAEEELREALAAREMTIREASHRVRNNLTMVASLIELEMGRAESEATKGFLLDLQTRIGSIGLIHELLYRGEPGEDLRLDEYLGRLCSTIIDAFPIGQGKAGFVYELEEIRYGVDASVSLGMMVAELVTNALKYAQLPGRELVILLRLCAVGDGRLELSVGDNGPGIPGGRIESSNSLGWELLESITKTIGGSIRIGEGPGALVTISLPGKARASV